MNKELLKKKLAENKRRLKEIRINDMKSEVTASVENFSEEYRFADENEIRRIETFMDRLPFSMLAKINFSSLAKSYITEHNNVWLCFLDGREEILSIYIHGNYKDILNDYDTWFWLSAYLLMKIFSVLSLLTIISILQNPTQIK
ncbi:MAG: hypothetical protein K2I80_06100 [Ruminococcus sp.]|nr:hypothetical protein [Ruminococcus sp.]